MLLLNECLLRIREGSKLSREFGLNASRFLSVTQTARKQNRELRMNRVLGLLVMIALAGCGGSGEVEHPTNPTSPPPPGSISTADEPGVSSEMPVE